MIFLFTNKVTKLVNSKSIDDARDMDQQRPTARQRVSKKFLCAKCVSQLKQMNRTENNSPIHLLGSDCVVYDDIVIYMGTKRKVVSVDPALANRLVAEEGADIVHQVRGG